MVESHWSDRNGDARKLEVRVKAEQELAKIEQQIEQLQAVPGQSFVWLLHRPVDDSSALLGLNAF